MWRNLILNKHQLTFLVCMSSQVEEHFARKGTIGSPLNDLNAIELAVSIFVEKLQGSFYDIEITYLLDCSGNYLL